MKKNLFVVLLASAALVCASMALSGCAQEPEDDTPKTPFEGAWGASYLGFPFTLTFSGDSWTEVSEMTILGFTVSSTEKGTFTYDESKKTLTRITTHSTDETNQLVPLNPQTTETVTYALSGSTLTLTNNGISLTYTKK